MKEIKPMKMNLVKFDIDSIAGEAERILKVLGFTIQCIPKEKPTPSLKEQWITMCCSAGRMKSVLIMQQTISKTKKVASFDQSPQLYKLHRLLECYSKKIEPIQTIEYKHSQQMHIQFSISDFFFTPMLAKMIADINSNIADINLNIKQTNPTFLISFFKQEERSHNLKIPTEIQEVIFCCLSMTRSIAHGMLSIEKNDLSSDKENVAIYNYLLPSTELSGNYALGL